ncbi:MAG: hypothetical protein H8E35_01135 [Ardenticatenia bacterium]|nr:hypothetical protein [Ardenticatenia bacterium]
MPRKAEAKPYPCRRCGTPTVNTAFVCDTCQRTCANCQSFQIRTRLLAGRFRPAHYCRLTASLVPASNRPAITTLR